MPRVHTHTKSPRATKRPYVCSGCSQPIEAGQQYYSWERRYGGKQFRHVACGYPRPTELSSRKTAAIEEALQDADLSGVTAPEVPEDFDGNVEDIDTSSFISDLQSVLEEVANVAREVGEEYESGADNMPESLQYGSQAEAMRDVASRLSDYADELDFEPSSDAPDWPEREEDETLGDYRERVVEALETWTDDVRQEAQDKLDEEMPEYEG